MHSFTRHLCHDDLKYNQQLNLFSKYSADIEYVSTKRDFSLINDEKIQNA